jgi:hypothetical protein
VELLSNKRPHINEEIALRKVFAGNKVKQLRNSAAFLIRLNVDGEKPAEKN